MRVIVMFDLPVLTDLQRKNCRYFKKFLIKNGFYMLQKSIYCKLTQNSSSADFLIENMKKNKPPEGLIQVLKITEIQFSKMISIVGEYKSETLDSTERLVIL